jgi:sigma54-dependent transcription regulator
MSIKIVRVLDDGEEFATILAQNEADAGKMMAALAETWEDNEVSNYDITVTSPDDFQEVLAKLQDDNQPDEEDDEEEEYEDEDEDDEDEDEEKED